MLPNKFKFKLSGRLCSNSAMTPRVYSAEVINDNVVVSWPRASGGVAAIDYRLDSVLGLVSCGDWIIVIEEDKQDIQKDYVDTFDNLQDFVNGTDASVTLSGTCYEVAYSGSTYRCHNVGDLFEIIAAVKTLHGYGG